MTWEIIDGCETLTVLGIHVGKFISPNSWQRNYGNYDVIHLHTDPRENAIKDFESYLVSAKKFFSSDDPDLWTVIALLRTIESRPTYFTNF